MLSDFGLSIPGMATVSKFEDIAPASDGLRYPLVLKTAEDHAHKSDVGGVMLNIADHNAAEAAYRNMAEKLGPRAIFMEMAPKGTELSLGAIRDDNFGPVVLISAGGVLIELLTDSVAALAPFDSVEARALLKELRIFKLLQGYRGQPPADLEKLCAQISAFSHMVAALADNVAEIDVNPLICTKDGAFAVDCLVVTR